MLMESFVSCISFKSFVRESLMKLKKLTKLMQLK